MHIFDLPPGHNERDIKRAYAKALKKIDVDESPGEFQQLYNAYQQALYDLEEQQWENGNQSEPQAQDNAMAMEANAADISQASSQGTGERTGDSSTLESALAEPWPSELSGEEQWQLPDSEQTEEHTELPQTPIEQQDVNEEELNEEQQAIAQHYQHQLEILDDKLTQLLATPKQCKQLYSWLFLNEFPELNDYDFWIEASRLVYHRLADSQSPEFKGKRPDITREVLDFLDSIFNWFEHLQDPGEPAYNHHQTLYNRVQDLHGVVPVAQTPNPPQEPDAEQSIQAYGLLAFIADASILIAVFGLLYALLDGSVIQALFSADTLPIAAIVYYIAIISSPMQATLGQTMINRKVFTMTGARPSFMESIKRGSGLFIALLCVVFIRLYDIDLSKDVAVFTSWGVAAISYLCWKTLNNTQLVHTAPRLKGFKREKELFPHTIFSGAIDFFCLSFLIGAFSTKTPVILDPLYVSIIGLLYYISMVASPLQGTIGQLILRYRIVDMQGNRPSLLDAVKRASGFICLSVSALLAHWNQTVIIGKYEWQLMILLPAIAFFVWQYFNNSLLVKKPPSSPTNQ